MKTGDKVRCVNVAKGFKQASRPGIRVGWVYIVETLTLRTSPQDGETFLAFSLMGQNPKVGRDKIYFAAAAFELLPDPKLIADRRAGRLK